MKAEEYYNEFFPPKMQSETPEFENLSIFSKRDMIKFANAFGKIKAKAKLEEAAERVKILMIDEEGRGEERKSFVIGGDIYAVNKQSITETPLD